MEDIELDLFEGLDFDLSGLEVVVACGLWSEYRADPDPFRNAAARTQAIEALKKVAQTDPSLQLALLAGEDAVDEWCAAKRVD